MRRDLSTQVAAIAERSEAQETVETTREEPSRPPVRATPRQPSPPAEVVPADSGSWVVPVAVVGVILGVGAVVAIIVGILLAPQPTQDPVFGHTEALHAPTLVRW